EPGRRLSALVDHRRIVPDDPSSSCAATKDEAKRDLAATWRRWLAMHGKDEATHRPFYGSPLDLGQGPRRLLLAARNGVESDSAQRVAARGIGIGRIEQSCAADDARRGCRNGGRAVLDEAHIQIQTVKKAGGSVCDHSQGFQVKQELNDIRYQDRVPVS